MVLLTFLEEVKDKASRLIPTAYMEIVEECTTPSLSIPTYEHVMFLCDSANSKPEAIVDIVRALRRRITNEDAAVRHLTILLLDAMMKNCASGFHVEVASQKGLLRDLVNIAIDPPTSARGMQAKEAALTLIMNLAVWFAGHPDPRCHILTTLANDVRLALGPNAFEGIRPDTNTRMKMQAAHAPPRANSASGRPGAASAGHERAAREKRKIIDAIPINYPTEETISGMLDACVALSEYLQNAEISEDGSLRMDDVILGFQSKILHDHDYVTILLSSNLQVDRDVLRSISDSQSAVLETIRKRRQPTTTTTAGAQVPQPVQAEGTAQGNVMSAPQPVAAATAKASPAGEPATTAATGGSTPPKASYAAVAAAAKPAPTMDDIFGAPTTASGAAPAPAPAAAPASAAPPAPTQDELFAAPPPPQPAATATEAATPAAAPSPATSAPSPAEASAEPPAAPAPAAESQPPASVPPSTVDVDAPAGDEREEAREEKEEPAAAPAAAVPPPAVSKADDDDDFDAFLDGKTK